MFIQGGGQDYLVNVPVRKGLMKEMGSLELKQRVQIVYFSTFFEVTTLLTFTKKKCLKDKNYGYSTVVIITSVISVD